MKCSRVLCLWDNTVIFVVFCILRAVHKFDFGLALTPQKNMSMYFSHRDSVFDKICMFSPSLIASVKRLYPNREG